MIETLHKIGGSSWFKDCPLEDIVGPPWDTDTLIVTLHKGRGVSYRKPPEGGSMFETPDETTINPSTEEGDVNVTVEAPEPEQQDDGNGGEQNTDDQA